MKNILILITAMVLCTGALVANASEFDSAWAAADEKRKQASSVGYEWRDTGKMLKQAKKAAEDGDMDKAMKLVAKAHEQSEDAIAQQARESVAWQARVPQ